MHTPPPPPPWGRTPWTQHGRRQHHAHNIVKTSKQGIISSLGYIKGREGISFHICIVCMCTLQHVAYTTTQHYQHLLLYYYRKIASLLLIHHAYVYIIHHRRKSRFYHQTNNMSITNNSSSS